MKKRTGFAGALAILILITGPAASAQQLLEKNITIELRQQRLDQALEIISNKGNFYFSYNTNIIRRDSLISGVFNNKPVKDILTNILGKEFEFRESGNYIILRRLPLKLRLVTSAAVSEDKFYTVSGYVVDDQTGEKISGASIYEKARLAVANTNAEGYFKIRLKSRYEKASITVSKEYYEDTTVSIEPRYNQSITITLVPLDINEHTSIIGPAGISAPGAIELEIPLNDSVYWRYLYLKTDSVLVERTAFGRFLVSPKAKLQSLNLRKFFVEKPYQVSLVPGLSTHGSLNSQVINNFSFNVLGGYTGGTNGFELGGLFNIDKKAVQYVQIAGITNIVGGHVDGLQIGGISNTVLDSVHGVQIGGVGNFVRKDFRGLQTGGVYSHTSRSFDGVQIGGVSNYTGRSLMGAQIGGVTNFLRDTLHGAQIAGVINVSWKEVNGVQIGGVVNYTRKLRGVQIGLINIADTSEGYSIGLINIIFRGYHKLSISTNEVMNLNASFKTGNSKLYSILLGGFNAKEDEKIWSFGYGLGSELKLSNKFSFNPELTSQHLYLGSWNYYNILNRASLLFNFKIAKAFSLYAGPVYSVYASNQHVHFDGYKETIASHGAHKYSNTVTGWFGWCAGINIF